MTTFFACLIAGISTAAFVALWFWVVRRELYAKQKPLAAARCQLVASKKCYMRARGSGEEEDIAREIMKRSEQVYTRSVQIYNDALHKPLNVIPAGFLGF
ncbi:MAG: hypothetical protein RR263_04105, partial [Oscillospiraceae bacterium]